MSSSSQQTLKRKPLLTVVVPGADVAPDRSHLEPRRSVHGARRSSASASAYVEPCIRRVRALAWLCAALSLSLLVTVQVVRRRADAKLLLPTLGLGPTDEQARQSAQPACASPAPRGLR